MYVSLGNLPNSRLSSPAAKRLVCYISIPGKADIDGSDGDQQFVQRVLVQEHWRSMLDQLKMWEGGILLDLPGRGGQVAAFPRVGLILGDLPENYLTTAVVMSHGVRCLAKVADAANNSSPVRVALVWWAVWYDQ